MDFIIDSDLAFNDFNSMIKSGEAKLVSLDNNIAKVIINKKLIKIQVEPVYANQINSIDHIIYGKNDTKHIVNISIKDDMVYIFKEDKSYVTVPYRHWVLSSKPHPNFLPLKGDQHFKYIKEYDSLAEFNRVKFNVYKLGMYTISNYSESFMIRHGYTYFKGMKPGDVSSLSFDIETTGLDPNADDAKVLLITNTFRSNGVIERKTFGEYEYETQADMINDWALWVKEKDPSLLLGHNIVIFDLPYINHMMLKAGQHLILGKHDEPIEFNDRTKELRVDGTQSYTYKPIKIFGREVVDTFFLAIKADIAKKYTSYGLKNIIKQEGLEKEGRQHYDASQIKKNWHLPEERIKIIQYAEEDSDDSLKLFDLMIAPFFYLTPHIPKPFQLMIESATGSQLNSLMVRSYLQDGFSVAKANETDYVQGGISFAVPGIYKNQIKIDIKSAYPSQILRLKLYSKAKDPEMHFYKICKYFTEVRFEYKKKSKETGDSYWLGRDAAAKTLINSLYGLCQTQGLNYNDPELASIITLETRNVINMALVWASGHGVDHWMTIFKEKTGG